MAVHAHILDKNLDKDRESTMPRTVRDASLATHTARAKLPISGKPKYRHLDKGLHIGYRRNAGGGVWVLRRYIGDERYTVETIGKADDRLPADGETILNFTQAQAKARARAVGAIERARIAALGPAVTVRSAVEAYIVHREERERRMHEGSVGLRHDALTRLSKHVLANDVLATKPLALLSAEDLSGWRAGLDLSDGARRRTANDFRAALNLAIRKHADEATGIDRDDGPGWARCSGRRDCRFSARR